MILTPDTKKTILEALATASTYLDEEIGTLPFDREQWDRRDRANYQTWQKRKRKYRAIRRKLEGRNGNAR